MENMNWEMLPMSRVILTIAFIERKISGHTNMHRCLYVR